MTEPAPPGSVQATPKVDPDTLSLRAKPAPAVKFRRGAVIAIAATASVGFAAVTWVALQPADVRIAGQDQTGVALPKSNPAGTLSPLPESYEEVPELGPPLPGDLGRPILRHREQNSAVAANAGDSRPMIDQAAAERDEQLATERRAAWGSAILVRSAGTEERVTSPTVAQVQSVPILETDRPSPGSIGDPKAQQRRANFLSTPAAAGVSPHRLEPPASPYMLNAGSIIAASLITGLRSDLPGLVVAQVTERVYDSATGEILLIPQGARLIGTYDSVVAFGQRRALVVWQRLILPDGSSLRIDNVPATDPSGYAGLADQVDFHTWSLLKGAAISTLLGVGSNLTFSGESDLVQAIRESTQQNASRAGDQLVSRNLAIQPTITIRPGAPVRLVVHRDLVLRPWKE